MLYAFEAAAAPEVHDLQYFEMFGNRGIYHLIDPDERVRIATARQ